MAAASDEAAARSRYYDLNILLDQPHPNAGLAPIEVQRATPIADINLRAPARVPPPAPTPRYVEPTPPPAPTLRHFTTRELDQLAQQPPPERPGAELRMGVLIHDEGPFSRNEEDGLDINIEVLFPSPKVLEFIWSPRPHIGVNANMEGDTSQVYFGLSWEWGFWDNWFAGFSLGGSVHDGETETNRIDRKELGCRLLFRESAEFGYRLGRRHGISLFLDHVSNGNICSKNEGLENFGLRYGYRF